MNLYLVSTHGLGDFWVVAKDLNEAANRLTFLLDVAQYGFAKDRMIDNVKIMANELGEFSNKPFFGGPKEHVILPETLKHIKK